MPDKSFFRFFSRYIPQLCRIVQTPCQDLFAIGRKGNGGNIGRMPPQYFEQKRLLWVVDGLVVDVAGKFVFGVSGVVVLHHPHCHYGVNAAYLHKSGGVFGSAGTFISDYFFSFGIGGFLFGAFGGIFCFFLLCFDAFKYRIHQSIGFCHIGIGVTFRCFGIR